MEVNSLKPEKKEDSLAELLETLELLIEKTDIGKRKIRLLGISLSNLDSD